MNCGRGKDRRALVVTQGIKVSGLREWRSRRPVLPVFPKLRNFTNLCEVRHSHFKTGQGGRIFPQGNFRSVPFPQGRRFHSTENGLLPIIRATPRLLRRVCRHSPGPRWRRGFFMLTSGCPLLNDSLGATCFDPCNFVFAMRSSPA